MGLQTIMGRMKNILNLKAFLEFKTITIVVARFAGSQKLPASSCAVIAKLLILKGWKF